MLQADSTWTVCAKNYLGEALRRKGEFEEARKLLQESRDAFKRAMGTEHPETIATLADIGQVNMNMGNFDTAGVPTSCIGCAPRCCDASQALHVMMLLRVVSLVCVCLD